MQSAQMRVNRVTTAIINEAAASMGLKLPATGRAKQKVANNESKPWRIAGIAAAVLALLAVLLAAMMWFVPLDQLIDAGVSPLPAPPAYQSRYPYGAKPIPQPDLLLPAPPTPPPPSPEAPSTEPASPRFSR
jgi:hypothetical protein